MADDRYLVDPVPAPPPLSGDWKADAKQVAAWMDLVFRAFTVADIMRQRVAETVDGLATSTQTISDPPTKAEVEAVQRLANDTLTKLRGNY